MIVNVIEKDTLHGIAAPKVITSDAQNERYIYVLLGLEGKNRLTAKEKEFAELLTVLIEAYEDEHYPIRDASPVEVLVHLMEANNLKQKDLAPCWVRRAWFLRYFVESGSSTNVPLND